MGSTDTNSLSREFVTRTAPGAPPGELTAHPASFPTTVRVHGCSADGYEHSDLVGTDALSVWRQSHALLWVDVAGLKNLSVISAIGREFGLHPLALEDVVHTHQRSKTEDYGDHLFVVLRMAPTDDEAPEQLSLFVGPGWVITIQECPGDDLDPVRTRLRMAPAHNASLGAGHLAYTILDAVVDAYFPVLERIGEEIEQLEDDAVLRPEPAILTRIRGLRRRLLGLRRAAWPLREAIANITRDDTNLFNNETRAYLRDVHDHSVQVMDLLETYRELASNLMDVYLSALSNRLNEVMKVLTIITTIFIPLTFVCGIYGMNFNTQSGPLNMPELNWAWGYPACLALMATIAIAELVYFKRKGWIGRKHAGPKPDQ